MWKRVFGLCDSEGPDQHAAFPQSDKGLQCPQTESLDTVECFSGEKMPGWNFAGVWDGVNLHILRVLEGTFLLDAAYL